MQDELGCGPHASACGVREVDFAEAPFSLPLMDNRASPLSRIFAPQNLICGPNGDQQHKQVWTAAAKVSASRTFQGLFIVRAELLEPITGLRVSSGPRAKIKQEIHT